MIRVEKDLNVRVQLSHSKHCNLLKNKKFCDSLAI